MRKRIIALTAVFIAAAAAYACTGIALKAKDGSFVQGRTIEWGSGALVSEYAVVPRGHEIVARTMDTECMRFTAKYGFVGLSVMQPEFMVEGMNEKGLSAGLFYFPGYGKYADLDMGNKGRSVPDLQFVSWLLSSFSTVEEVKAHVNDVIVVPMTKDNAASTVHWRVADASGAQIVIEIVNGGEVQVFDNPVGVLTNSPGFQWQLTNLNNYVNLYPGNAESWKMGDASLFSFGAGTGMLGLPGDVTPPSRFVRAAFLRATAPQLDNGKETVFQIFHLLNNFDVPVGVEHKAGECPDMPSATQWTAVSDMTGRKLYYKTAYNNTIRCLDLGKIDFGKVEYQAYPLDKEQVQPVEEIVVK